ncbi:MAG: sodium:calcium antiporter, partial [Saprospiraceae bacterium]
MIYILMLFGFVALIKGADMLVEGASSLAKGFGISDLVVGLTIVSLGTSMPELIVTMMATVQGNAEVGVGNILGSNIANILLILGVTVLFVPINVQKTTVFSEIHVSIIAALLVGLIANTH